MIKKLSILERKSSLPQSKALKSSRPKALVDESSLPSMTMTTTNFNLETSKYLPPLRSLTNIEDKNLNSEVPTTILKDKPAMSVAETKQPDTENDEESVTKEKFERIKLPIYQNITDIKEWKRRHKLDPKVKVYIVTGGYGDIKKALDKRGWIQNPDPKSRCFDMKWTIKSNESEIPYLEEFQLVNHFEKNATITTKAGLCRNLKNLIWFSNVDINTFYPKCYDLNDEEDYEDFIEEFKYNKAESWLKLYVRFCGEGDTAMAKEIEGIVKVAVQVCEKKTMDLDEALEAQGEIQAVKISEEEWKILSKDEISLENLAKKKYEARLVKYEKIGKAKKKSKKKGKRTIIDAKNLKSDKEEEKKVNENAQGEEEENEKAVQEVDKNELLEKVNEVIERLKKKNPQSGLIGDKNIWMLKPAGLSRGRGITCLKNLIEILDLAKKCANPWVVQKYIENPLIIHKRKFDIRQWVLVTDWNPLTVWFYEECYVRFSGDEYNADDLENRFVHLTNNSVTKHLKKGEDDRFEQNMWRMETFQNHLKERFGSDVFEDVIKPKMKQAVTWSLESVQDMIGNKKNSFELYGYDFMVDDDLNVWLIEINLSPSLDYSTPVTKRLVKMVSEDVIKVVVDHNMAKKKKRAEVETGLFTCIHKSKKTLEKPMKAFGLDLVCEGNAVEKLVS